MFQPKTLLGHTWSSAREGSQLMLCENRIDYNLITLADISVSVLNP